MTKEHQKYQYRGEGTLRSTHLSVWDVSQTRTAQHLKIGDSHSEWYGIHGNVGHRRIYCACWGAPEASTRKHLGHREYVGSCLGTHRAPWLTNSVCWSTRARRRCPKDWKSSRWVRSEHRVLDMNREKVTRTRTAEPDGGIGCHAQVDEKALEEFKREGEIL